MATWVTLQRRDDRGVTFFFNTHFDHQGEIARRESPALLRREVETLSRGLPAVITGDFNGFEGRTDGARIDWIVVTPSVRVIDAAIDRTNRDGRYPSDHFPVTALIALEISGH